MPHLEYCIQAWRPYNKKDIDTVEQIKRRATKIIPELTDFSYENIDRNIFSHSRKIIELEDMR